MLANGLRIQRLLMGQHFLMVDFGEVLIKEQVQPGQEVRKGCDTLLVHDNSLLLINTEKFQYSTSYVSELNKIQPLSSKISQTGQVSSAVKIVISLIWLASPLEVGVSSLQALSKVGSETVFLYSSTPTQPSHSCVLGAWDRNFPLCGAKGQTEDQRSQRPQTQMQNGKWRQGQDRVPVDPQ